MSGHPVKRALERDIVPYFISARKLRQQWFYRLHVAFGYTTDIAAAFAAVGVSLPVVDMFMATENPEKFQDALLQVPNELFFPAVLILIFWIVLRVAFVREDGQKRAVLAKSNLQTLRLAEAKLPSALSNADPMPALTELLEKIIRPTVDSSIQANAWPWLPFAPDCGPETIRMVSELCQRYESDWSPVDPNEMDLQGVQS